MPKTFHVTAPDGHVLEITGPDDATEEQALAQAQSLYKPADNSAILAHQAEKFSKPISTLDAFLSQYSPGKIFNAVMNTAPGASTGNEGTGVPVLDAAHAVLGGGVPGTPGSEALSVLGQLKNSPIAKVAQGIRSLIPSTERAGQAFDQVANATKEAGTTVDTTKAREALARAEELRKAGSTMPKVLRDFAKAQESGQPMTFQQGRDFASNASALSSREVSAINQKMQRQVVEFASAMKDSNREAAASLGMGDLYDQAMKEYRGAKTLEEASDVLKKWGRRAAITALGATVAGAAAKAGSELYDVLK